MKYASPRPALSELPKNGEKRVASNKSTSKRKYQVQEGNDEDGEAAYWRNKFLSLHHERLVVPEAHLSAFAEESAKNQRALKSYAIHLEGELHTYKAKHDEASETASKLQQQLDSAQRTSKQQEELIQRYQMLTAMTFSKVEKTGADCTVVNEETGIKTTFRLTSLGACIERDGVNKNETPQMMLYEPLENPGPLPDFLQGAIEFESTQCPALMQNVLKSIFPEED